jgi:hypothetical protein
MKYLLTIISITLIFCSCNSKVKNSNLITNKIIDLGEINPRDTTEFNVDIKNPNTEDTIFIKKISSDCNCTILESDSFFLNPLSTISVKGVFIPKKDDTGLVVKKISINSTASYPFNIVEIKAFVIRQ